ncbi:MAG TPA: HNH endonuclease [Thermoanaerobaculia bacterium]|nr:HNH endonuclease [Thermoanaerobaculia bacterium]
MRGFIANADPGWVDRLRNRAPADEEIAFWRAGTEGFRALDSGEPFFFKMKAPREGIAGLGSFAHFSVLPVSLLWEIYGPACGEPSFSELRERLLQARARVGFPVSPEADFDVGAILLLGPIYFPDDRLIEVPDDFGPRVGQGKTYDLAQKEGARVWIAALERIRREQGSELVADGWTSRGLQRLGPRSFRVAVLDAWDRVCAVSGETALPALDATQIRQAAEGGDYSISNGLLLRSDIRRLFDAGHVTVSPDYRFLVSGRLREGAYGALHGVSIRLPKNSSDRPAVESLWWHSRERFLV